MLPKLGIIAGGGMLPRLLAQHCLQSGRPLFVIVLRDQGDLDDFTSVPNAAYRIGAAGGMIKRLRAEGVEDLVFAGSVRKPPLSSLRPDLWSANFLMRTTVFSKGDDTLLRTIIAAIEAEGFRVLGADDVLPDILAPLGCISAAQPSDQQMYDIEAGITAAKALGAQDKGQAVVANAGVAVAHEDRRGTAAMLEDLAARDRSGVDGGVLVKVTKPTQDRRVDLPAIGSETITQAKAAGLAGIALSAGGAILLDRQAIVAAADREGLFVIGIDT